MYICYLDESGAVESTANTDHFVLLGLAIPADTWRAKDFEVSRIKTKYGLEFAEVHTAWMLRDYPEQRVVPDFESLPWEQRRRAIVRTRALNLSRCRTKAQTKSLTLNYRKTQNYTHLTRSERTECVRELAQLVGDWHDCRIFADAHAKIHLRGTDHFAIAFEQVVTRFNTYLTVVRGFLGLLVHDNNQTMAGRLTTAMRKFHRNGTLWSQIDKIVETPMFVDSQLTSMVQLADLSAYAVRRFLERGEDTLYQLVRPRIDRKDGKLVGVRHYTGKHQCHCQICVDHGRH